MLLVAATKSYTTALLVAVCAYLRIQSALHKHTLKLVISFRVIDFLQVLVYCYYYLLFVSRAALTIIVSKLARRYLSVKSIFLSRPNIIAVFALLRVC